MGVRIWRSRKNRRRKDLSIKENYSGARKKKGWRGIWKETGRRIWKEPVIRATTGGKTISHWRGEKKRGGVPKRGASCKRENRKRAKWKTSIAHKDLEPARIIEATYGKNRTSELTNRRAVAKWKASIVSGVRKK